VRKASGLAIALMLVVLGGVPSEAAWAHALLRRAIPPTGQTLSQAPTEVRLLFSEPLDASFSSLRVVNQSGAPVDLGDARVDPTDEYELVATLPEGLPNGVYTVAWRSLSTIDVHPDSGQYPLFVGVPVTTTATAATTQNGVTPETTLARWAFYLTVSLFGGILATWKLVFNGLLVDQYAASRAAAARRARWTIVLGGGLLIVVTLFAALAQASAAAGVPLVSAIGQPVADLLGRGRFAAIWWPRFALEVISVALVMLSGLEGVGSDMALAMVPAILLTSSLTSHAAALPGLPAAGIALDWLHLVSGVVWIGGLGCLAVVLPSAVRALGSSGRNSRLLVDAVRRFSRLALAAAVLVALSGTLQAALELGSLAALGGSPYGQIVMVKVGLLLAMLALAIFNQRSADRPLLPVGGPSRFVSGVRAELLVGLGVLAAAALLTGTPPAA
jgi:copper transport protein